MTIRIGFDLDGVLADLASAYRDVDRRLFGAAAAGDQAPESPSDEGGADAAGADAAAEDARGEARRLREERRRRQIVWHAIETTDDFWTTLKPTEEDVVRRLAEASARHRWEVFFVTRRPGTAGETAQRQTQRWLVAQGFELPSVIVMRESRGKLAAALELDYLVDDTPQNVVDVVAEATTRVILVNRSGDRTVAANARRLGVAVVGRASEAIDLLERAATAAASPTLVERVAKMVGWT
jgi:hypothetical protein